MDRMPFEPKFNDVVTRFSSRNPLGIESVATSIEGVLCPIINTVTPRAFYWPFLCWIYYDFYKYSGIKDWTVQAFDGPFLKRQDYFFVLANIIAGNPDQTNLVGKQKTSLDYINNVNGPYGFNKNYFITRYGGMQYYNAGCVTMHFLVDAEEETGKPYTLPRLTQYGEQMARAFEDAIKSTRYYKDYRLSNKLVPKDILLEYARIVRLEMDSFPACKKLLREHLFVKNHRLNLSSQYAKLIVSETHQVNISSAEARSILFDLYSPKGTGKPVPDELCSTARGWELVVGRQYFTIGIEIIWKNMLLSLNRPMGVDEWINAILSGIDINISKKTVGDLKEECFYSSKDIENMVIQARRDRKRNPESIINGLKITIAVYNRFAERDDLGEVAFFLDYGGGRIPGTGVISMNEWIKMVESKNNYSIKDFLTFLIHEIIDLHKRTCFEKLTRSSGNVDGFFFNQVSDLYIKNEHIYDLDFQGNRFIQLIQVMNDLDMFEEEQ